jgi:hypothetical protein
MRFGEAVRTDKSLNAHFIVNPFEHLSASENHTLFENQVSRFEIGVVQVLDVMRLVAHQDVALMAFHQLQRLTCIEIGLHDHPAT